MRVVIYSGGFAPVGGIETFLHDLILGVADRGLATELVCWGPKGELLADLEQRGLRIHRQAWRWGCRWKWPDRLLLPAGCKAVERADVVLFGKVLETETQRALAAQKSRSGRPRFVLVTPYRPSEMWAAGAPPEDVLNCFETIVVQGVSFETELRGYGYRGDVRVLPYLPPACEELVPFPLSSALRVGYLGRLAAQKNLAYLLQCIAHLRKSREATLDVFGEGIERRELEAEAKRVGMNGGTTFHGYTPRAGIQAAISSCHVFAFTSISEGQPLAALEILAGGRPIVATPVGVFPEMLSDSRLGMVAPLDEPIAYAGVLRRVGEEVVSGGRKPEEIQLAYSERYCRQKTLDAYLRLFRDMAS